MYLQPCRWMRWAWAFHHQTTQSGAIAGHRSQTLRRAFGWSARPLEMPSDLWQHDVGTEVATWPATGRSPALVQRAVGRGDLATTMGYAHLVDVTWLRPCPVTKSSSGGSAPVRGCGHGGRAGHDVVSSSCPIGSFPAVENRRKAHR